MSDNAKKVVIKPRTVFLMITVLSILFFSIFGFDDARKQTAFSNAFEACAKRVPQDKNYQRFLDTDNIPCYQKALQAGHDLDMESMLASLLVKQGRYAEARPLYAEIAHPDIVGLLVAGGRTAEARQMLQPNGMEKARAKMLRSDQAQRDLLVVTARNQKEENDFLLQHAIVRHNQIMYMSEADKAVWKRMRQRHSEQQHALAIL